MVFIWLDSDIRKRPLPRTPQDRENHVAELAFKSVKYDMQNKLGQVILYAHLFNCRLDGLLITIAIHSSEIKLIKSMETKY